MNNNYIMLPLIAIKDIVILKGETITLDISKKKSIYVLESVLDEEKEICLVLERENNEFNNIGTVVKINKYSDIMPTVTRIVVEGIKACKIEEITQKSPFFKANCQILETKNDLSEEEEIAFLEILKDTFADYAKIKNNFMPDVIMDILSSNNIENIFVSLINKIELDIEQKLSILNEISLKKQLENLLKALGKKIKISKIEAKILNKTRVNIDKTQKEYYLKEQLKAIKKELNKNDDENDAENYKKLLANSKFFTRIYSL